MTETEAGDGSGPHRHERTQRTKNMPLRDADTVRACPACDSTEVSRVIDHERAGTDKAYRCNECRAKFDEPKLASARTASADAVLERAFGLDREAAHEAVFGE